VDARAHRAASSEGKAAMTHVIDTTTELDRIHRAVARSVRAQWPYLPDADLDDIVDEALARALTRGIDLADVGWLVGAARRVAFEEHRRRQRDIAVTLAIRGEVGR